MRVKTYKQAVHLARCAGEDAANRRMRKAGRAAWSAGDHDHACRVATKFLADLGFDVVGWSAMAGVPRNEPDDLKPPRRAKRRSGEAAAQLSFAFPF